jgi:DNA-binding transcriptional regulator YiaG
MPNNEQREKAFPIAAIRRRLNMTQEEFAHAIGVTVSTVNRWENGHITPSRLARRAMESLLSQIAAENLEDLEPSKSGVTQGSNGMS